MQARDEMERTALEIGAVAVRLRDRGYTWTRVGEGLGVGRDAAKHCAVAYLLKIAEVGGEPAAGGIVQPTRTSAPRPPHFMQ
jgi:hypothetical protein